METLSPRLLSSRPSEAAVMPLPKEETTPPVTKINLVCILYLPSVRANAIIKNYRPIINSQSPDFQIKL